MRRPAFCLLTVLLVSTATGCDGFGSPSAPSTVLQPIPEPPPSPQSYTLTPSSNTVTPGGQLSVSWTATRGGVGDWIGLFGRSSGL